MFIVVGEQALVLVARAESWYVGYRVPPCHDTVRLHTTGKETRARSTAGSSALLQMDTRSEVGIRNHSVVAGSHGQCMCNGTGKFSKAMAKKNQQALHPAPARSWLHSRQQRAHEKRASQKKRVCGNGAEACSTQSSSKMVTRARRPPHGLSVNQKARTQIVGLGFFERLSS